LLGNGPVVDVVKSKRAWTGSDRTWPTIPKKRLQASNPKIARFIFVVLHKESEAGKGRLLLLREDALPRRTRFHRFGRDMIGPPKILASGVA
jgi:hypothetical protein